jgi:hypothetical protein
VTTNAHYLSIDPGENNGVCGYDANGQLLFMITVSDRDLTTTLKDITDVRICVLESYRVFPNKFKRHIYSDLPTVQAIGRVLSWAELNDVRVIKQPSSAKAMGYKYLGRKPLPKSNPANHQLDAHAHFTLWAVKNRVLSPKDLLRNVKNKSNTST